MNLQKRTARGAARALPLRLRWCFANELSASAPRIPATTTKTRLRTPIGAQPATGGDGETPVAIAATCGAVPRPRHRDRHQNLHSYSQSLRPLSALRLPRLMRRRCHQLIRVAGGRRAARALRLGGTCLDMNEQAHREQKPRADINPHHFGNGWAVRLCGGNQRKAQHAHQRSETCWQSQVWRCDGGEAKRSQ